jgi:hypothetical protein
MPLTWASTFLVVKHAPAPASPPRYAPQPALRTLHLPAPRRQGKIRGLLHTSPEPPRAPRATKARSAASCTRLFPLPRLHRHQAHSLHPCMSPPQPRRHPTADLAQPPSCPCPRLRISPPPHPRLRRHPAIVVPGSMHGQSWSPRAVPAPVTP